MAQVMEYKCPSCGGAMEFDIESQKLKCQYCDTTLSLEDYNKLNGITEESFEKEQTKEEKAKEDKWQFEAHQMWSEEETKGMKIYSCKSCGAQIIADETAATSTCPYCGNNIAMEGNFSGGYKPELVIPFKITKDQAIKLYKEFLQTKKFVPKPFKDSAHIEEMKAMYVPYWFFNVDADAKKFYDCTTTSVYRIGDREITETSYYDVRRCANIQFKNIPVDGSKTFDDVMSESIEPFDHKAAVEFSPAYLAGFISNRYDVEPDTLKDRIKHRVSNSIDTYIRTTLHAYGTTLERYSELTIDDADFKYGLCPVWILTTRWEGKPHVFAINGQTGKLAGDLPFDKGGFTKCILKRWAIIGVILFLLMLVTVVGIFG